MEQSRALDVVLGAMHEEMVNLQGMWLEAQEKYLNKLQEQKKQTVGWISVKDGLPEDQKAVLAVKKLKNGTTDICIARCMREYTHYDYEKGQNVTEPYWICGGNNNIIFWMPIPEKPENL